MSKYKELKMNSCGTSLVNTYSVITCDPIVLTAGDKYNKGIKQGLCP